MDIMFQRIEKLRKKETTSNDAQLLQCLRGVLDLCRYPYPFFPRKDKYIQLKAIWYQVTSSDRLFSYNRKNINNLNFQLTDHDSPDRPLYEHTETSPYTFSGGVDGYLSDFECNEATHTYKIRRSVEQTVAGSRFSRLVFKHIVNPVNTCTVYQTQRDKGRPIDVEKIQDSYNVLDYECHIDVNNR